MKINVAKLTAELVAAEIPNGGTSETGVVWDIDGIAEIQNHEDVAAVIAAHDPWNHSISPSITLVKINQDVVIDVRAAPGVEMLLINVDGGVGEPLDVAIDDDGAGQETFVPAAAGEYVITGESGELANCITIIKAVE